MSPLELQRILDGEIDHATRAQLLRSLGDDVQQWRALALAMIEEQQWAREIRKDPFGPSTEANATVTISGLRPPHQTVSLASSPGPGPGPAGRFLAHGITALAASALLCMGIAGGMWYRSQQTGARQDSNLIAGTDTAPMTSPSMRSSGLEGAVGLGGGGMNDNSAPMKMVLAGLDNDTNSKAEIPLMDAEKVDPNWVMARDNYELAELRQQLRRRGYRLEVQPKLYSGRLNDGSHVVVPVHNVALKSVGL